MHQKSLSVAFPEMNHEINTLLVSERETTMDETNPKTLTPNDAERIKTSLLNVVPLRPLDTARELIKAFAEIDGATVPRLPSSSAA